MKEYKTHKTEEYAGDSLMRKNLRRVLVKKPA